MKSKAIIFEEVNKVGLKEIELPELSAGRLFVRNTITGVSVGTERWALIGKRPEMKYPHIPGYQGVGVIEQVGPEVAGFAVGDRVVYTAAVLPEPYCSNSWMGTHLSHAIVSTKIADDWPPYICKVPDGVDDASMALSGLAAVAVQGTDMLKITSKDTAVVLGMGMIGQFSAQVLRARGARVVVADKLPDRIERALSVGCDAGIVLGDGPIAPQLAQYLPGGEADIVVDTTSVEPVVQQLASLLRHRGQILMQGYYPGLTALDIDSLHAKRPTISVACSQDIKGQEFTNRLLQSGHLKVLPLITHHVSPSQAAETYRMIIEKPEEFLGIVFDWSKK